MLQAHLLRESIAGRAQPEAKAEGDEAEHIVRQSELNVTREVAPVDFRVLAAWDVLQLIDPSVLRMIDSQDGDSVQIGLINAGRDAILRFERFEAFPRL